MTLRRPPSFRLFRRLTAALVAGVMACAPAATAFETQARHAYVIDHTTGTVLLEKAASLPMPPASMSKLMTLNMLFEALKDGRVTMETEFRVSARAAAMGGSKMFLRDGERVAVRDLIPGIIVHSGNDACVVVAEGLAGSEEAFARLMNERGRALGLSDSTFSNSSGWPDPNQRMSAHDLAILARRMIQDFPEYYGYFAQQDFTWADIHQPNRNPLLGLGIGADGLKTGHTAEAGYGLVGSARQGDRRIIFVLAGLDSERQRAEEAERIVNWAFRQFSQRRIVRAGQEVARAEVWLGEKSSVGLAAPEAVEVLIPALVRGELAAEVVFTAPIEAPVAQGQQLGELVVQIPDLQEVRVPLVAAESIARGGFAARLRLAAQVLIRQLLGEAQAAG
jgi:D-alanyl-D-alanine carboxypeptidase (penicillin-binding protein 5/6)